ncbi:MAG: helix-turn-helix transcriptional regulator [Actinobacteria bacterium]|nr:helix-turn-helix transcriptional regulator [Actinomycetota bacterium]
MPVREELPARKRRGDTSPLERAERLTGREVEILQLTADGLSMEEIAARLDISPHTIRTHVQNCLTKLGVHSKLEAITFAIRTGKVRLETIGSNGGPEGSER